MEVGDSEDGAWVRNFEVLLELWVWCWWRWFKASYVCESFELRRRLVAEIAICGAECEVGRICAVEVWPVNVQVREFFLCERQIRREALFLLIEMIYLRWILGGTRFGNWCRNSWGNTMSMANPSEVANSYNGWWHRPHICFLRSACVVHVSKHRSGSNLVHTWEPSRLPPNSRNTKWWWTKLQEVWHNRRPVIHCLMLLLSSLNKQAHMNLIWQFKKRLVQSPEPATRACDGVQVTSLRIDVFTEIESTLAGSGLCTERFLS